MYIVSVLAIKGALCPKRGFILLRTKVAEYVKGTVCKTWSCPVCREKVLAMFRMRAQYGCLTLGRCYLITLTQRADQEDASMDAAFVNRAWTELVRSLKERSPNLSWLKVIETTKRGVPHLHLLVGGIGQRSDNCAGRYPPYSIKFINQRCERECLVHEWGAEWFKRTGNYVVDAREVYSVGGAVGYLSKYISKGFMYRPRLEGLGFTRRWSCSRNWPRESKTGLRGSIDGWESTEVVPRFFRPTQLKERELRDASKHLMETVGDPLSLSLLQVKEVKGTLKQIERLKKHVYASI